MMKKIIIFVLLLVSKNSLSKLDIPELSQITCIKREDCAWQLGRTMRQIQANSKQLLERAQTTKVSPEERVFYQTQEETFCSASEKASDTNSEDITESYEEISDTNSEDIAQQYHFQKCYRQAALNNFALDRAKQVFGINALQRTCTKATSLCQEYITR